MSQANRRPAPKGAVPPRGGSKAKGNRPPSRPAGSSARPSPRQPGGDKAGSSANLRKEQQWERKRRQLRNRKLGYGAGGVVILAIAALIIVGVATSGGGSSTTPAAPLSSVNQITGVKLDTLTAAATSKAGSGAVSLSAIKGPASLGGPVPTILYEGAEYCPYCAAERWPLVMALSKFGTFTNLRQTTSSSTDTNANTPTFSFLGTTYSSPYLKLTTVEEQDRTGQTLQKPTKQESSLAKKYDNPPYVSSSAANSIPFILFGNQFALSGAQYDAKPIAGKSFTDAATILSSPSDPNTAGGNSLGQTALAAQAAAGKIVGAICGLTNNKPPVCATVPASLRPTGQAQSGATSPGK